MPLSIEDELAIEDLLVRYAYVTDLETSPEDAFLALFTEDAVLTSQITGRYEGREGQKAFAEQLRSGRFGVLGLARSRHVHANFEITGEGDEAFMRAYVVRFATDFRSTPVTTQFVAVGHYDCDVRRVDGEWRLASRHQLYDHITGTDRDRSHVDYKDIPYVLVPA